VYEPLASVMTVLIALLPGGLWCAWWLWCVDWKKLWPVLARGAWAPAVLMVLMAGMVWNQLDPVDLAWPGYYLPALVWHMGAAVLLAAIALTCGWLQGVFHWTPPEFPVHPAPVAHGHDHGHGHH
jgi:hypothetical protein